WEELERKGWGQDDLARILGRPKSRINEIVLGKQSISVELAVELASAFGTSPQIWIEREATYRFSMLKPETDDVRQRARLYDLAPVKELQKGGWISTTEDSDLLERELLHFLEKPSSDEEPAFQVVFRKTHPKEEMTPPQRAWCSRIRQIARTMM